MSSIPHLLCATHPSFPSIITCASLTAFPQAPAIALVAELWYLGQEGLSSTERLLCPSVSLLGNRTQKYEFNKEIIKKQPLLNAVDAECPGIT